MERCSLAPPLTYPLSLAGPNMRVYSPQELNRVFLEISGKGLFVPITFQASSGPRPGPKFMVYRKFSEVVQPDADLDELYWRALQQADVVNSIGEFSFINANISESRAFDPQIHRNIAARFVLPQLLPAIFDVQFEAGGMPVLFSRINCLQTIRHLVLYGGSQPIVPSANPFFVGRLALLSNEFLQVEPIFPPTGPTTLDLLLLMAPSWDIFDSRNLGHAMSRIYILLTDILPGNDPIVVSLLGRIGMTTSQIQIDGLPLNEFVSIVFGLFAYGNVVAGEARVLFRISEIFRPTGISQALLVKLIDARARSIGEFRVLLAGGQTPTRAMFDDELRRKPFLSESLNCFRKYPMLRLDDDQVVMLDIQFVIELLTSGVYWSIFDGLPGRPSRKREDFKELWGRMYELYIVWLLGQFYPPASAMFTPDISFAGGQVDALLDFGSYVVVMEIKSSLLTEPAKRSADKRTFIADFKRKFVEKSDGSPKAIKQLAAACRALLAGAVPTPNRLTAPAIYPVFVSDEPIVEATFANTYFNEWFQQEGIDDPRVKPVTVMSTDEIEQILPHAADGDLAWDELLQERFNGTEVRPSSVGQTIYDLLRRKGLRSKQNPALKTKADEVGEIIRGIFQPRTPSPPL